MESMEIQLKINVVAFTDFEKISCSTLRKDCSSEYKEEICYKAMLWLSAGF